MAKKQMTLFIKLEKGFFKNRKVREAGLEAAYLYIVGLNYANENLTDGFIPMDDIPYLYMDAMQTFRQRSIPKLVKSGLWSEVYDDPKNEANQESIESQLNVTDWSHGKSKGEPIGYLIKDYLDYNMSKKEVEELRSRRGIAGKRGAKARWNSNPATSPEKVKNDGKSHSKSNGKSMAYTDNNINILTTSNKLELVKEGNDFQKLVEFGKIFESLTGVDPTGASSDILEKAKRLVSENVGFDEYKSAILEMQEKGYAVTNIASPVNWVINNRGRKKTGKGKGVIDMGGYIPDTSGTIYVIDDGVEYSPNPDMTYIPDTSNTIFFTE